MGENYILSQFVTHFCLWNKTYQYCATPYSSIGTYLNYNYTALGMKILFNYILIKNTKAR